MEELNYKQQSPNSTNHIDKPLHLGNGFKKIGELFTTEIKLIRTIFISFMTVLIICILLYFNYILIGEFFTTIFLSFIASLAVKPLKKMIIHNIEKRLHKSKYFSVKSFVFIFLKLILILKKKILINLAEYMISKISIKIDEKNYIESQDQKTLKTIEDNTVSEDKNKNSSKLEKLSMENGANDEANENIQNSVKVEYLFTNKNLASQLNQDNFNKESLIELTNNKTKTLNDEELKIVDKNFYASSLTFANFDNKIYSQIKENNNYDNNYPEEGKFTKEGNEFNEFNVNIQKIESLKFYKNEYHLTSLNSEDFDLDHTQFSHREKKINLEKIAQKTLTEESGFDHSNYNSNDNHHIINQLNIEEEYISNIKQKDNLVQVVNESSNNNETCLYKTGKEEDKFHSKINNNNEKANFYSGDSKIQYDSNKNINSNNKQTSVKTPTENIHGLEIEKANQSTNKFNNPNLEIKKGFIDKIQNFNSYDFSERVSIFSSKLKSGSYLTIFNNYKYLIFLSLFYVMVFKLTFYLSITLIVILLMMDFLIRFMLDLFIYFLKISEKNFLRSFLFEDPVKKFEIQFNQNSILITNNETNENFKTENTEKIQDSIENKKENIIDSKIVQSIEDQNIYQENKAIPDGPNNDNFISENRNIFCEGEKSNCEEFHAKIEAKFVNSLIPNDTILKRSFDLNENAHSYISLFIIFLFTFGFLVILTIILLLFYFDMKKIYFMLSENNDFVVDYFKNFIPNNISEFYFQNPEEGNNKYINQNKILIGLKSLEAIFNSSFEGNSSEQTATNYTIYGN